MTDDASNTATAASAAAHPTSPLIVVLAWLAVGLPLLWGVAQTFSKALALFR